MESVKMDVQNVLRVGLNLINATIRAMTVMMALFGSTLIMLATVFNSFQVEGEPVFDGVDDGPIRLLFFLFSLLGMYGAITLASLARKLAS